MGVDLEWEELQTAIADSVADYCADRCGEHVARAAFAAFPRDVWEGLGSLGVFDLGGGDGDAGPKEICAAMEALGRALFPGPLAATFAALSVLDGDERAHLASGSALVSLSAGGLVPWAPLAETFLVVGGERLVAAVPAGEIEPVGTIGGEPWGRVTLETMRDLGPAQGALAVFDMCVAAYVAASGERLVEITCEHVSTRKQFGRTLGEFQAVSHPLADASMKLAAASLLARRAACALSERAADSRAVAAAARLSARSAGLAAAATCHQAFGALGVTIEGPVFPFTRRIRQLAALPPDAVLGGAAVLQMVTAHAPS